MIDFDARIATARRCQLHQLAYETGRVTHPLMSHNISLMIETMEAMQARIVELQVALELGTIADAAELQKE